MHSIKVTAWMCAHFTEDVKLFFISFFLVDRIHMSIYKTDAFSCLVVIPIHITADEKRSKQ